MKLAASLQDNFPMIMVQGSSLCRRQLPEPSRVQCKRNTKVRTVIHAIEALANHGRAETTRLISSPGKVTCCFIHFSNVSILCLGRESNRIM